MEKTIVTTFMIIASVIAAVMVFNAVYPAVNRSGEALVSRSTRMDERMKSQIAIVHVTGELDRNQTWQDTNGDGRFNVFVWVKNVGSLRIAAVDETDLFFGPEGNFTRIPHKNNAGGSYPYWEWQLENDVRWNPTATLKITISFSSIQTSQRYFVKAVIANGLADSYFFSM